MGTLSLDAAILNTSKIARIILTKLNKKMQPRMTKWLNLYRINNLMAKKHPFDGYKEMIKITLLFLGVDSNKETQFCEPGVLDLCIITDGWKSNLFCQDKVVSTSVPTY